MVPRRRRRRGRVYRQRLRPHYLAWHPQARVTVLTLTYAGNLRNLDPVRHEPRFAFVRTSATTTPSPGPSRARTPPSPSPRRPTSTVPSSTRTSRADQPPGPQHPPPGSPRRRPARFLQDLDGRGTATWGRGLYGGGPPQAPQSVRRQQGRGDPLAFSYHTNFGLPVLVTRGANTIGPYQYPEKATPSSSPTPWTTSPLPVYGDARPAGTTSTWTTTPGETDLVLQRGTPGRLTTWAPRTRWTPCNWPRASSTGQAPQPDPLRPRPPRPRLPLQPGQP